MQQSYIIVAVYQDAVKRSNILHHDLSPGNVVVDETGWLVNWDLLKVITEPKPAQQNSRTMGK
ncbi:hypothetical protein JVU11DRAFT_11773 [Chiua virens]|nr:hypothetical protein JVU11DRAFT_11773 [Chiua virens]